MFEKQKIKKFLKPTKKKIIINFLVFFILFCVFFIFSMCNFSSERVLKNVKKRTLPILAEIGFLNEIKQEKFPFITTIEHKEKFGIEIANISSHQQYELRLIAVKTIKAIFDYYETGEEQNIERVKEFFLPDEYERFKEITIANRIYYKKLKEKESIQEWNDFLEFTKLESSYPREYKDLENRIGLITIFYKDCFSPYIPNNICAKTDKPFYIFIFKKQDNGYKIEKIKDGSHITKLKYEIGEDEQGLIGALLSENADITFEQKQELHSIIAKTIRTIFDYYEIEQEENIEPIKDLFISQDEYERLKRIMNKNRVWRTELECKIPSTISLEFSNPRKLKSNDEINILTFIPVQAPNFDSISSCCKYQYYIFNFENIDNKWKMQRIKNYCSDIKIHPETAVSRNF